MSHSVSSNLLACKREQKAASSPSHQPNDRPKSSPINLTI